MLKTIRAKFFLILFVSLLSFPVFVSKGNSQSPPQRDPVDQPFRRAPMASSARSIIIPLATNLHFAFDAELLRAHTVWNGPSLNLLGPPYSGKKSPFICTFDGAALWTMPPVFPWSVGEAPPENGLTNLPTNAGFRAISTETENTALIYDIAVSEGKSVRVRETPVRGDESLRVVRGFEIAPSEETLWFLVHAEIGKFIAAREGVIAIQRERDVLTVGVRGASDLAWHKIEKEADYEVERITEAGTVKGNPRDKVQGHQSRAYLKIPPHSDTIRFEVVSTVGKKVANPISRELKLAEVKPRKTVPKIVSADPKSRRPVSGDAYFRIEHFPLPKEIDLLVAGMDWLPDGNLAVATWPGEIYIVENAQGPIEKVTYRRFARGLNEPMGLKVINGEIYVAQKVELTRVIDRDKNGEADLYETVNAGWGNSGHYDSFAFGPALDNDGNFYIAFEGHGQRWDVPYMGWAVKISPDGKKLEGISHGLRAPNGIAAYGKDRDIFVSDNQGNWIGACKLNHIQPGKFFGFPSSFPAENNPTPRKFDPPAIWFPRSYSPSTTDIVEIKDARFGPFQGQLMVGDFQNAIVMRVMLEKVNGEYQGAVWPFSKGFSSGVNRLVFGPDGKLYVGGCQRAWVSTSPQPYSLERVSFTGKIPFEIKEVHALTNGFELIFTQPVDPETASVLDNYDVSQFTYKYHERYGSLEIDHDGVENSSTSVSLKNVIVSPDRTTVKLLVEGWRAGYVTVVNCLDVTNADGDELRNDTFYYTLNQIPK